MKYIDFDGVIKDTYLPLFSDYFERRANGEYIDDTYHVINKDWYEVLRNSPVIADAVSIINSMDDVAILTKIHSLENEGVAKIKDLRNLGVTCDIILVPYPVKKTEVVNAKGNILVDDAICNLDDWAKAGGIPIFFDSYGNNADGGGIENKHYTRTRSLDILRKY
jgi:hypothetical protein